MSRKVKTRVQSKEQDPGPNQSRFHEACEAMKKSAARFMESELSSESSEEEINEAEVMKKTLSNYAEDETHNLRKIREFLQDILTSGAVVCLICIESVKRSDEVWSCGDCYCMFHLHCIQKWAKDSMHHLSSSQDQKKRDAPKWCCPKCRSEYEPEEKPSSYLCFCGKVERPPVSSWGIPHACEHACDKRLKPNCGHTCCLLCHPGPCPPCPQTVLVSCCCSKSVKVSRRCSHKEWFCGKPCGKMLPCKIHKCEEPCHSGVCPPCKSESRQKCQCGLHARLQPCHDAAWQCDTVCSKPLQCGNHLCNITCHRGTCPGCPNSGPRPCPCGKKNAVLQCTENVSPCGDTCGKLLECQLHRCSQRCHYGPCEKCLQMRVMKCKCGLREKSVPCCKEFSCDTKCKKRRDCGRHNCSRKCCLGNCPPCELPCGKMLNCGKHKCSSLCHPGPCYPCHDMVDVTCSCGSTKISVPCGRKRTALPPRCSSDCKLPSDCHHQQRHKHKCHFGVCPPCRLVCDKTLQCGHSCPARCHSAVLTKIDMKQKREGPWDLMNSYIMELVCKPCPPCGVLVPVTCIGGHETQQLPCSAAVSTSCGKKCGRALLCGNHACSLQCHKVEHVEDLVKLSEGCETCQEACQKARRPGCAHPCPLPCHPGKCKSCKQHLKMKCHCQISTLYVTCDDWIAADSEKQTKLLTCSNRCPKEFANSTTGEVDFPTLSESMIPGSNEGRNIYPFNADSRTATSGTPTSAEMLVIRTAAAPSVEMSDILCGHRCIVSCHPGPCSTQADCKKKVVLRCLCRRKKRDAQCMTLTSNESRLLECDEECSSLREAAQVEEGERLLIKQEEERREQEAELQEFLRKAEGGKKKKRKKPVESHEKDNRRTKVLVGAALAVCIVGCLVYFLMS